MAHVSFLPHSGWRILMALRIALCLALLLIAAGVARAEPTSKLSEQLKPFISVLDGTTTQFTLIADVKFNIGKEQQQATLTVSKTDSQTFSLSLKHDKYPLILLRDEKRTVLALPAKKVLFLGEGEVSGDDILAPDGVIERLIGDDCSASTYYSVLRHANSYVAALTLTKLAGLRS